MYPGFFVFSNFVAQWIKDVGIVPDVIMWLSIFGIDPLRYHLRKVFDYMDRYRKG